MNGSVVEIMSSQIRSPAVQNPFEADHHVFATHQKLSLKRLGLHSLHCKLQQIKDTHHLICKNIFLKHMYLPRYHFPGQVVKLTKWKAWNFEWKVQRDPVGHYWLMRRLWLVRDQGRKEGGAKLGFDSHPGGGGGGGLLACLVISDHLIVWSALINDHGGIQGWSSCHCGRYPVIRRNLRILVIPGSPLHRPTRVEAFQLPPPIVTV